MQSNHPLPARKKRSFPLTLLAIFFLTASLLGWVRVFQTIQRWKELHSLPLTVPVWFILVSGGMAGLAGLLAAGILWRRIPRAQAWVMAAASLIALLFWGEKIFFAAARTPGKNLPFEALVTFLLLFYTWAVLRNPDRGKPPT